MQRLSAGKVYDYFTTIGYDYSSRNATTIVRPYWLSGDSPKRDAAGAANGSAPPCQANARLMPGVVSIETLPGWHGSIAGGHAPEPSYIPYYNRRFALTCAAFRRGGGIWYVLEGVRARVCPPAWHRWYYSRLCRSGICGG